MSLNYEQIGYDKNLNRNSTDSTTGIGSSDGGGLGMTDYGTNPATGSSSDSSSGVNSSFDLPDGAIVGDSLEDLWIASFIKSKNYKPKTQGFLLDGIAGYIECMKLYVGTGGIIGGSLSIPDETSDNSFHVDVNGNTWWGANVADGYLSADAYILNTGVGMLRAGTVGGWTLGTNTLSGTGVTISSAGDAYLAIGTTPPTGVSTGTGIFINKTGLFGLSANTQNFKIDATNGYITAIAGTVGGWTLSSNLLKSASSGARIELNQDSNRISVFDAVNEKVVMGYLNGLPKNDGTGNWGAGNYGFWARSGDKLSIDGDGEYTSGDWIIQNDAAYLVKDASDNTIIRLGTDTGEKGLFIYNTSGAQLAKYISDEIYIGDTVDFLQYTTTNGLQVGKIDVGSTGRILGGQTDFNTGTGFYVGVSGGEYKFSIGEGSSGNNYLTWDGDYLRIKGNLDLTSIFNNISYTVANLPIPPTSEGFNSPTAYEY